MSQPHILSLVYQDRIEQLCARLKKTTNFSYFVSYIIFNNGQIFVISNMFHMLEYYYAEKLYNEDFSFKKQITSEFNSYLCNEVEAVTKNFENLLENKFNIYRAYYIIRNCPECQFVFGAINDRKFDDYKKIYKTTLSEFEDFCCEFIDSNVDIIKKYNPTYYSSIVLNDKHYRRSIIKTDHDKERLTQREIECLHWTAQGKSSEETAIILGINTTTVNSYRNQIKAKLKAANMAQAVFEGVKNGYLGAFNKCWEKNDLISINGLSIVQSMAEVEKELSWRAAI